MLSSTKTGYLFAFLATLLWSGNFILSKVLAADIPPVLLATLRWSIALIFLLPLGSKHYRQTLSMVKQHIGYFLIAALMGVTCFNTFVYIAGHTTNAINMALVCGTSPIFTLLFSWVILKERVTFRALLALILGSVGVMIAITKGDIHLIIHMSFTQGDLWALAAALSFAAYSVLVRLSPAGITTSAYLAVVVTIGLLLLLPATVYEYHSGARINWHNDLIGYIIYLSIGMSVIAYLLWNKSIALIGAANTATVYYSLPVLTSIEAVFFLQERFTIYHLISGLFIVSSILVISMKKYQRCIDGE